MRSMTQRSGLAAAGSIVLPVFMLGCGANATDRRRRRMRCRRGQSRAVTGSSDLDGVEEVNLWKVRRWRSRGGF